MGVESRLFVYRGNGRSAYPMGISMVPTMIAHNLKCTNYPNAGCTQSWWRNGSNR